VVLQYLWNKGDFTFVVFFFQGRNAYYVFSVSRSSNSWLLQASQELGVTARLVRAVVSQIKGTVPQHQSKPRAGPVREWEKVMSSDGKQG